MTPQLTVDVIIPVFNGEKYIIQCLKSVLRQTYTINKIIITDDGSTDKTKDIIHNFVQKYPNIVLLEHEHKGVSHARNLAISKSDADFIAFLDSDDIWYPEKIEKQLMLFTNNPNLGVVYCSTETIDSNNNILPRARVGKALYKGRIFEQLLIKGNIISGSASAVIVKRSCLQHTGGFDTNLSFGEDWDLWLKLAYKYPYDFVPEILVQIRNHSNSIQNNKYSSKLNIVLQHKLIYDKWINEHDISEMMTKRRIAIIILKDFFNTTARHNFLNELKKYEKLNKIRFFRGKLDLLIIMLRSIIAKITARLVRVIRPD